MKQSNYQHQKSAYSIYTSGRPTSSSLCEQMGYSCFSLKAGKRRITQAWITSARSVNEDAPKIRIVSATGRATQARAAAAVTGGGFGDLPPSRGALHVMQLVGFRPTWHLDVVRRDGLQGWVMVISWAVISDQMYPYPCCDLEVKRDLWLSWHPERARNMRSVGTKSSSLGCCKRTPRYGIHCQSSPHLTLSWCWQSLIRLPHRFSTHAASLWWSLKSDQ